jgi:hypothetical protein
MKFAFPCLFHLALPILLLLGCSNRDEESEKKPTLGELITRKSDEHLWIAPPQKIALPPYPWEEHRVANLPKITKEFFRCKGSPLNPEKVIERNGKTERISDCGGSERHSLPLNKNKEFIYPILITLLNHVQSQTEKKVVVTSGHRCPEHNTYVDPTGPNSFSKHLLGAEVSFYVQGMEDKPDSIIEILKDYYINFLPYKDKEEFVSFHRYESNDTNVTTQPWFNKEVFIKLFKKEEGRNFDNRHPYPYISIQVRYDLEKDERVTYSWDKSYKNYLRK